MRPFRSVAPVLCVLTVASVSLPAPVGAGITAISRLRDVITFATIQPIEGETLFDSEMVQTGDSDFMDEAIENEITLDDALAGATCFQTSDFHENGGLFAFGGFDAASTLGSSAEFAEALGSSRVIYRFEIDTETNVDLFGTLVAEGAGVANAVLVGPGSLLLNLSVRDDLASFTESFVLEPGAYELSVNTSGYGQALPESEFPARGNFEVFLFPETPASVPEGSLAELVPVVAPNPVIRSAEIRFQGPVPEGRSVFVVGADGRVVRNLGPVSGEDLRWDTRNDQGTPVSAGVYFIRVQGSTGSARALVLR